MEENQTEFAALKSRLPGPLQLHADNRAPEYLAVMSHKSDRALKIRKVVCVRTPPKPGLPGQARQ
jgi:hypothetical protein